MKYLPIIIMLVLLLGANIYVVFRFWQMLPAQPLLRIILIAAVAIALSSMFIYFLAGNHLPAGILAVLYKVGTSWIFILLYLVMVFILIDIAKIVHLIPPKILLHNCIAAGTIALLISGIMLAGYFKYTQKKRVEITIATGKAINTPLKIVAVSDLHLGYGIGKKELEKWVNLINKEQPDIIIMGGDIIDNNVAPLYQQNMAESLKKLQSTYGIYAIPGNHEYISGISKSLQFLREAGINVLKDSSVLIDESFYIIGRDDRSNPDRKSMAELVKPLDNSKPMLLMDHQPYHLEEAEENGIDFQFSGHTHRGQVWPISWITDKIYEKSHGYLKKGNTHIYVSSGLGIWGGKFRIGTQSEFLVVQLQ